MTLKDSYLTITQAAKKMGVSRQTISNWLAEGKITAESIGREKLIPRDQLVSAGKDYWTSIITFHLYTGLRVFLGYKPKDVVVKGLFGNKPAQATVTNPKGKVEYIEVIPQKSKSGKFKTNFNYRKVAQFSSPFAEDLRPDTEVTAEVGRWGEIIQLSFKDLSTYNKAQEEGQK